MFVLVSFESRSDSDVRIDLGHCQQSDRLFGATGYLQRAAASITASLSLLNTRCRADDRLRPAVCRLTMPGNVVLGDLQVKRETR